MTQSLPIKWATAGSVKPWLIELNISSVKSWLVELHTGSVKSFLVELHTSSAKFIWF